MVPFLKGFLEVHKLNFLYALALVAAAAMILDACAPGQSTELPKEPASLFSSSNTLSGGYLAGRFAQHQQDWDAAETYMGAALDHDQSNELLMQRTFLLSLGAGNFTKAKDLAQKITLTPGNAELALIFLGSEAIRRDDFAAAVKYLDKLPAEGFGQYTKPLLTAWALVGMGKGAEAKKLLAGNTAANDPTFNMHVGMMEELAGNMDAAAKSYQSAMKNGLDLHTAVMIGNFFERYNKPETAAAIYKGLDKAYPFNPFITALSEGKAKRAAAPNITRPAEGASMVLFELATLLYEKRAYDSAQIYGSMVQMLDPKSPFTKLMMGDIAALYSQYDKSVAAYSSIERESPVFWLSRMRIAEVYEVSDQLDQSVKMLTEMSENPSIRVQAFSSLGDIYRRHNQFENAIKSYDAALEGIGAVTKEYWPIVYARGISRERANDWGGAEKDLLQALSFQPENPMILNFIAYGWANQGVHLEKALEYARQAAALRPNDGYILDSYGWTLFRLARYEESIRWLEDAVAQIPNDSTLLDHLGDAYWQVGRRNEAQYKWKQSHDLSRDASFKRLVQEKIKHGIVVPDQVDRKQAKL